MAKPIRKPMLSSEERMEMLKALGQSIADKRQEAVSGRANSGIEAVWMDCEEAYLGLDDANRGEFAKAKWAKPLSSDGPVTTEKSGSRAETRSTAFVRLTSRYVDAGTAKLAEILLPIDDKPFSFDPTPIPDLIKQAKDLTPVIDQLTGQAIMRPARPDEVPQTAAGAVPNPAAALVDAPAAGPGGQPAMMPVTQKDLAEQEMNKAKDAAKRAEKRIYDWMVESGYQREMRKVIHDAARIGVGVLKAPFPDVKSAKAITRNNGIVALQIQKKVIPAARWVDPWNIFPDPACGENIHDGDFIFERDFLSQRKLKELKKQKGFIPRQIDNVIKEGPGKCNVDAQNPNEPSGIKNRYEIWYFYGTLTREELTLAGAPGLDKLPQDQNDFYAIVRMVNDSVIGATINPLESGDFPFHSMPWTRRAGHWAGVGVGEQVSMPQRMVNAATRAMLNNAGKSAGSIIVMDQGSIVPADGNPTITPDKIFYKLPDDVLDDIRKAFAVFQVPNITPQMMSIIEYAFRLAEDGCNIPLITQGKTGPTTPETLGATELQNNNANTLLRSVGYAFDDFITEPVVHSYYEWLLLDPDVPDEEKGDFQINAHGSIALVERAIQDQTIQQMGGMVKDPAFGVNPKKWFKQFMKSKRLDPRDIQYTEEEQKRIDEMNAKNPPQDPRVQAATITAQARLQEAQVRSQTDQAIAGARVHGEMAYAETERQMAADNAAARHQERQDERELLILKYALQRNESLDKVKADLAKTAIIERTKKELAAAEIALAASEGDKNRAHKTGQPESLVRDEMTTPTTP